MSLVAIHPVILNPDPAADLQVGYAVLGDGLIAAIVQSDAYPIHFLQRHTVTVALLDLAADHGATDRAGDRRSRLAFAAANLVTQQAAHDTSDHGADTADAADTAVGIAITGVRSLNRVDYAIAAVIRLARRRIRRIRL